MRKLESIIHIHIHISLSWTLSALIVHNLPKPLWKGQGVEVGGIMMWLEHSSTLGRLGGSVGWTTVFGSGHDPGVPGSSPTSGSQLHGESASPSDLLLAHALSHCLSLK